MGTSNACGATDQVIDELCTPPEVCGENAEEAKRQHLLKQTTDDGANFLQKTIQRDKPLFVGILIMVVLMRIPYLKFILYPFMIFSTWVHEMCHGMAALLVGGGVTKLYVYKDGSGLAYTWTTGEDGKRAFVASAGYLGTALIGAFLLLWRRTRRGPTAGLIGMGLAMLLSVCVYVRNAFGITAVSCIGLCMVLCGWKLPVREVLYLYSFMAATCSFNALDSINDVLDMGAGESYVNGQATSSDAHTVADLIGMTYGFWATLWLIFALVMATIGLLFPFNGITYQQNKKEQRKVEEGTLPQHGRSVVPASNTYSSPPPTQQQPPPAVNPQYQQQQQHAWQQTDSIPIAHATIY